MLQDVEAGRFPEPNRWFAHGIPAYAYTTEMPVAVLGAKYKRARDAGLL